MATDSMNGQIGVGGENRKGRMLTAHKWTLIHKRLLAHALHVNSEAGF